MQAIHGSGYHIREAAQTDEVSQGNDDDDLTHIHSRTKPHDESNQPACRHASDKGGPEVYGGRFVRRLRECGMELVFQDGRESK
jgi:hypothetical protein